MYECVFVCKSDWVRKCVFNVNQVHLVCVCWLGLCVCVYCVQMCVCWLDLRVCVACKCVCVGWVYVCVCVCCVRMCVCCLTWRPSLRQSPLEVFVGAMVTTGGVLGTVWPPGGTSTGPGPRGPLLGVLTGELWLVAGDETGDDSLLMEDPATERERHRERETDTLLHATNTRHTQCWD